MNLTADMDMCIVPPEEFLMPIKKAAEPFLIWFSCEIGSRAGGSS